jgi:membrane-associated phospholipid phosphatase
MVRTPQTKQWVRNLSATFADFDLWALAKQAYRAITVREYQIWCACAVMFALFIITLLINFVFVHYQQFIPVVAVLPTSILAFLLLFIWLSANRARYPKTCMVLLAAFYTFLAGYMSSLMALGAMLTPSPWLLSQQLRHVDALLHFHQLTWMVWASHYPRFEHVLTFAYTAWSGEIVLMAPLLALCRQFKRALTYIFLAMIILTVCCVIYMIWPSLPPAADFSNVHFFEKSSYALIHRYYAIHQHHIYHIGNNGLIAFPSFHVAMALLMIWATRYLKWVWPLLIIFNGIVIISTLLLGYHYLVDVIGSGVITGAAILLV